MRYLSGEGATLSAAKIPLILDLSLTNPYLTNFNVYFAVTGYIEGTGL